MLKKKDKLLEILKGTQKYSIFDYLIDQDLINLALVKKSYYLQLLPQIKLRQLDNNQQGQKQKLNPKGKQQNNKKQKDKKQNISSSDENQQAQVQTKKFNLNKWPKDLPYDKEDWLKLDKLSVSNKYLQKKFDSKCYVFFKNNKNNDLLYVNRTMIDPNLDFQKEVFDEKMQDIYNHMYEDLCEIDISSKQLLLKRHKEMLEKTNKKKLQNAQKQIISYEKQLERAVNMKRYAIILCFGGSFSLAIYESSKCIIHQSDKKYVCRKKAGERQFNKDKQSGSSIKSMGSQIRRDQQKKHMINVNEILNANKEELFKCEIIFLQAPGMNRLVIINQNETMAQLQQRLRSVCLTAKKANFTEVQLINQAINTVHWVKVNEQFQKPEKK